MKRILLPVIALILLACGREFEPELTGWRAYTLPGSVKVHLNIDGRETTITLPGRSNVRYRFPQWTKSRDRLLLVQMTKTGDCDDFQLIAIDTSGTITDTIYTAPPRTALNFKLAPNDSLLLLKTYDDDCQSLDNFKYTFYNRYLKTALLDTIRTGSTRGLLIDETVWSPDSKNVILSAWSGSKAKAFTYNLVTKDTTYIDKGVNFLWSPTDNDMVAYIKDFSICTRNIKTGKKEILFQGKRKRSATDFRWNPQGDILMIHLQRYLLNVEAPPFQSHTIIYLSMKDKTESRTFLDDQRIDTWIEGDKE